MKNLAIARRYAKALMLIGKEDGNTEGYREELGGFADLLVREKDLKDAICNPIYDAENRTNVLQKVLEKIEFSKNMKIFFTLLLSKGRMGFVGEIDKFYQKLADEFKGIARADLVSASVLPEEGVEKISVALSKVIGKEVILEVKQDAALIGGIVTKIGDLVIDGSIRTQLINMRESLKKGESV